MPTLTHPIPCQGKARLAHVLGAFLLLGRRARELGRPGLATWTEAGERAAVAIRDEVRDGAHAAEVGALSLAEELRAMIADGEIDADELGRLRLAPERALRIADTCHELGEIAR